VNPATAADLIASLQAQSSRVLAAYLSRQRWYRSKTSEISSLAIEDYACEDTVGGCYLLALVKVHLPGREARYFWPLAIFENGTGASREARSIATLRWRGRAWRVQEALRLAPFQVRLAEHCRQDQELATARGRIIFRRHASVAWQPVSPGEIRLLGAEQSNTSLLIRQEAVLKVYRQVESEANPEVEMLRVLNRLEFAAAPRLLAEVGYRASGESGEASLAMLQNYIPNEGDGWEFTLRLLKEILGARGRGNAGRSGRQRKVLENFGERLRELGEKTGSLHLALSRVKDEPGFIPRPCTPADTSRWQEEYRVLLHQTLAPLRNNPVLNRRPVWPRSLRGLAAREARLAARGSALAVLARQEVDKIRCHGDFHLGQVLNAKTGWVLFDFEGEPMRPVAVRRALGCPLKDVAGMLRSISYAAHFAAANVPARGARTGAVARAATAWEKQARAKFLEGYGQATDNWRASFLPARREQTRAVLDFLELEKAIYELNYEMNNRPEWVSIPVAGIQRCLATGPRRPPDVPGRVARAKTGGYQP